MYQGSYDPSLTLTGTYRDFGITEEIERRAGAEMPTNRELLQSLRDGFEQLALFDELELNSLGERARMIIERVFGRNKSYYERLSATPFHRKIRSVPLVSSYGGGGGGGENPTDRKARESAWPSGQQQSISFIDLMLEDLELREPEQVQGGEDQTVPKSNRVFVVPWYAPSVARHRARC